MTLRAMILGGIATIWGAFAVAQDAPPRIAEPDPIILSDWAAAHPLGRPEGLAYLRYASVRPDARPWLYPATRWDFQPEGRAWTRSAVHAMAAHGQRIDRVVPGDIGAWCPAYPDASRAERRAFWVGFMSALAKHESTYRPDAVGGGGLWYGLLQILPDTARRYGCRARTGAALKDGADNLSCAIRILNVTVPRDGVIATKDRRWRGVAADWGPMRSAAKVAEMQAWTRKQPYCVPDLAPRAVPLPQARQTNEPSQAREINAAPQAQPSATSPVADSTSTE